MTRRKPLRGARATSTPLSPPPDAPANGEGTHGRAALPTEATGKSAGVDERKQDSSLSRLVGLVIVVAVALGLYGRASSFGFVYVDDDQLIVETRAELLASGAMGRAFSRPYFERGGSDHAYYRPLVTATYVADARLGELGTARTNADAGRAAVTKKSMETDSRAAAYHRTNLALHAIAVGLLYLWLLQRHAALGWAVLGATLFAVHPTIAEAVAWIPGRPDALMAVFALGAWLLHEHTVRTNSWTSRILHCVAWLFALWSKEAAIVMPVLWGMQAFMTRTTKRPLVEMRVLLGWALVLTVYLMGRKLALSGGFGVSAVTMGNVLANLPTLLSSFGKLCAPLQLAVLATPEDTWLWPGIVSALALCGVARWFPSLRRELAFAVAASLFAMLPSLPATRTLNLESRLYFPLVPLIGLVVCVAQTAASRSYSAKAWVPALGLVLVILFGWRTHGYLNSFRDRRSFTLAAVAGSPHSALAHRNLGVYYHLEQQLESAQREYETALRLDPTQVVVHNNLGVIYMAQAKLIDAERELRDELSINPSYAEAHHNLAMILHAKGRDTEAVRHWTDSLASNSRDVAAMLALFNFYESRDPAQAEYYRKRLSDAPSQFSGAN